MHSIQHASESFLIRVSRVAAGWALGYGLYRWYYAAGGTFGMLGTPLSQHQWRLINAIAGVLLFVAAFLPSALLNKWRSSRARPILLAVCWIVAVSCVSHALIGIVQRVCSLTGALTISYPFWHTIDRREADLQALFFNEPWFLIEGLLWSTIAWAGALRDSPRRLWWFGTAAVATAASTIVGLLSAFGVIGKVIIG
jgi:uncharacterized protein with PQ loop repeat